MRAKAMANANIALIKYWGKRDDKLILPQNSNIAVNLAGLTAKTSVTFDKKYKKDSFLLDGKTQSGEELARVVDTLNRIRKLARIKDKALVMSANNFPTAAGLASSAAGGSALVLAASKAAGLDLSNRELSILARMNSGSSCRSIDGGFVKWVKGVRKDGKDSYGKQLFNEFYWPDFRIIVTILSTAPKKIKSRAGMKTSVENSPFYRTWSDESERSCDDMERAIKNKDIAALGSLAEKNAIMMHCVMFATTPSIIYWSPETVEVINAVHEMREKGIRCYFTMDAGPQVKIICLKNDVKKIKNLVLKIKGVKNIIVCRPGTGAKLIA
jgi:diphosphomevalonate decarboxylase